MPFCKVKIFYGQIRKLHGIGIKLTHHATILPSPK